MKKFIVFFLLLFIQIKFVFSLPEEAWDNPAPRNAKDTAAHALMASRDTLLSNIVLTTANRLIGFEWATPTLQSIKDNFTLPWQWENTDGFLVNQMGHPYQGAVYYNAGRSNGFSFYESIFFSSLGSVTWETMGESKRASINDLITTIPGSMAVGEMLYRLHLEAHAAGSPLPLTFLISPMGGFHILVTGGKQTPDPGKNLHQLKTYIAAGTARTHYSLTDSQDEIFSFNGRVADIGLKIIYGDPFDQNTIIPYRHFELFTSISMNPGNHGDYRFISDGYLFSFSPLHTDRAAMSTGLSMHLDFISLGRFYIYSSTIDMYSNALGWSAKHQYLFSENTSMQTKGHAGFTFWGASNYFSPEGSFNEYSGKTANDLRNYGYGINSKLFYSIENNRAGRFDADFLFYALWTYPGVSALSQGTVFWLFTDLTYSRHVSQHFSLGITNSLAREWGMFSGYPDTKKKSDSLKVFVAWNI